MLALGRAGLAAGLGRRGKQERLQGRQSERTTMMAGRAVEVQGVLQRCAWEQERFSKVQDRIFVIGAGWCGQDISG